MHIVVAPYARGMLCTQQWLVDTKCGAGPRIARVVGRQLAEQLDVSWPALRVASRSVTALLRIQWHELLDL
jgi:hypothetical protein